MNLDTIHPSKTVRGILIGLAIAIVALAIFLLGMMVGSHRERFAGRYSDNFDRNFVNPHSDRSGMPGDRFLPGEHGAVGEIVSINLPLLVVAGPDNLEKTVVVKDDTLFREFSEQSKVSDLKAGDFVVVLGQPNDQGQVEAKLIRKVVSPTASSTSH